MVSPPSITWVPASFLVLNLLNCYTTGSTDSLLFVYLVVV